MDQNVLSCASVHASNISFKFCVICTPVISEEKITSNDRHKVMALDLSSFFWPGELNKNFQLSLYGRTDHRRVKKRKYYISKQQRKNITTQ
jgi:hypothetical protein